MDGVPLLENGTFLTIDAGRVLSDAARIGKKYKQILEEKHTCMK